MLLHEQPWWPDFVDALRRRPLVQVIPIYALDLDVAVQALVEASDGGPAARQPWWPEARRIAAVHGVEEAARVFQTNERRLRRAIARITGPAEPAPPPIAAPAPPPAVRAEPPAVRAGPPPAPAEPEGPAVVRRPTLGARTGTRRVVRWSRNNVPPAPAQNPPPELPVLEPPPAADAGTAAAAPAAAASAAAASAAAASAPEASAADGPVRRLSRRGRTRIIRREPIEAEAPPPPKAPRRRRKGTGPHGDVRELRLDELERAQLVELVEESPDDGPRSVEELLETAGEAAAPVEEAAVEEAAVEEAAVEEAAVEEAAVEEAAVEEAAVEEAPVEEAAVEEAAAEEATVEEATVEEAAAELAPVEEAPADEALTDEALPVAALRYGWLLEVDGRPQGGLFLAADALAAAEQVARWAGGHVPARASLRRVGPELRPGAR